MASLTGKTILVAGGAGEVGEGIVRQLLKNGATVIVPSRTQGKLDELRERLEIADDGLITMVAAIGSVEGAEKLRARIAEQVGDIDGVIASLGGWWQGQPLTEISFQLWNRLLENSLNAHFVVARTFVPAIADKSSSYTFINGGGGLHPVPTAGPISISAAGQLMMQKVLAAEAQMNGDKVRINSLVLATPIITRSRPEGEPGWLTADDAGQYAAYLASDAAASIKGETVVFESRDQLADLE